MALDPRIPLLAAQGAQVNLADIYKQKQEADMRGQQMQMQREQMDWQRQQHQTQQEAAEKTARRQQIELTAKLLDGVGDEATYQQRRQAAIAYGMDPSGIPDTYNPEWVQTHQIIAQTLLKPDGEQKLTTMAQELRDAGYQPGSPEFVEQMRRRIALGDSKIVSTTDGGMAGMLGPDGYKPFILPNPGGKQPGAAVGGTLPRVNTLEEAKRLPPGTRFIDPTGVERVVPGGAGGNVSGGFPGQ